MLGADLYSNQACKMNRLQKQHCSQQDESQTVTVGRKPRRAGGYRFRR
jgi:hypothetical protein